ncbi:MAG: Gldg family protein [Lachnospirales bacterium]
MKIIDGLKSKKVRYGTFSTLTALLVLAVLVLVNIVAGYLNKTYDLTPQSQFSLSDETKEILKTVDQPIILYSLYKAGEEDLLISTLLDEYAEASEMVTYENIDPYVNPTFVEQFNDSNEAIENGSIIISGESGSKVVAPSEMVSQAYNGGTSYDIEPQVTNGIVNLVSGESKKMVVVSGHNEIAMGASIQSQLELANFEIENLELLLSDIPEDTDVLFMATPSRDYTAEETKKVNEYLEKGGNAFIVTGLVNLALPNFDSIYNNYGIEKNNSVIFELDESKILDPQSPILFLPSLTGNSINESLKNKNMMPLVDTAVGLNPTEVVKQSIAIENVLTSSDVSFGKTNLESSNITQEAGDISGPLPIAVAISDRQNLATDTETNLVVVSSYSILNDTYNSIIGGGNGEFILSSTNWLSGAVDSQYISSFIPNPSTVTLTATNVYVLIFYSLIALPVIIIAIGVFVWLKRRNR